MIRRTLFAVAASANAFLAGVAYANAKHDTAVIYGLCAAVWCVVIMLSHSDSNVAAAKVSPWK